MYSHFGHSPLSFPSLIAFMVSFLHMLITMCYLVTAL